MPYLLLCGEKLQALTVQVRNRDSSKKNILLYIINQPAPPSPPSVSWPPEGNINVAYHCSMSFVHVADNMLCKMVLKNRSLARSTFWVYPNKWPSRTASGGRKAWRHVWIKYFYTILPSKIPGSIQVSFAAFKSHNSIWIMKWIVGLLATVFCVSTLVCRPKQSS